MHEPPVRANPGAVSVVTNPAARSVNMPAPNWWRWLLLSGVIVVLDLATKAWITVVLREGQEFPVTSFFSLVLAYNSGAAFSFLAGAGGWQRWVFAGIAIAASVFIVWMMRRGGSRLLCLGLALILGGALGNLWDRVALGHVTDFLLFHYAGWSWPAFNVADSAITIGAACLILDTLRPRRDVSSARAP